MIDAETGQPIANAPLALSSSEFNYPIQTDANGNFSVDCVLGGDYFLRTAEWGFLPARVDLNNFGGGNLTIELEPGYFDGYGFDLGWTTTATASAGLWERGEPQGTTFGGDASNPDFDITIDGNDQCYVTGNGGGNAGTDDVDNGEVTLTSPAMDLSQYGSATLSFYYWFFNEGGFGGDPNDTLTVSLSNGIETVILAEETESESAWRFSGNINLDGLIAFTDDVRVTFTTSDREGSGHLVEAAVDVFQVVLEDRIVSTSAPEQTQQVLVWPNPSTSGFQVKLVDGGQFDRLAVFNAYGQLVWEQNGIQNNEQVDLGQSWPAGLYLLQVFDGEKPVQVVKLVKQ